MCMDIVILVFFFHAAVIIERFSLLMLRSSLQLVLHYIYYFYKYFCISFFSIASFMDGVLLITQDQH